MELHLRLPGNSATEDAALASKGAELAVLHSYGLLAPEPVPAHATNECDDAGCQYLGKIVIGGITWLLYCCGDLYEYYLP